MTRNYRRCGGCHFPQPYCDCKDYSEICYDIKAAKVANEMKPAYFGTKNFGFYLTTEDGVDLHAPQFQAIGYDGSNYYIFACDKYDRDGCVIKYRSDWSLVRVGPVIRDIGHAKGCYYFKDGFLYIAQRYFNGSWNATGMHKVDAGTLASVEFNNVGDNAILAFVQVDEDLYCVGSDSTKLYRVKDIDVAAGTIDRELVTALPLPGDFYTELSGTSPGVQAWFYNGRTVAAIRNNPQFAMVYDTITKNMELSHIGDVSDGRYIGEIEGAFTWKGKTVLMSVCDQQDPLQDANGVNYADIYIQFWYYDLEKGCSGSLDVRENTHATFALANKFYSSLDPTTNRSIIINAAKDNFYCNGSQLYPFHSVHEALAYKRYHPTARGIQFQSNFDGFIRAFGITCDIDRSGGVTVTLRFTDNWACDWRLKGIHLHDCEFYQCNINLLHDNYFIETQKFDHYYMAGNDPPEVLKGAHNLDVFEDCIIWCDANMTYGVNFYEAFITGECLVSNCNIAVCNTISLHE